MSDTPRNNKTKSRGNDYIVQGSILAAAAVITLVRIFRHLSQGRDGRPLTQQR